ncbi:hypothetical protein A4D02_17280 [Niastella koreensis]|uniref:Uncharacterized protein n=1 Tax=Niastella koreensis TaxID=354356 RepID=A0ABX3NM08_9BACT|nr:hypothetical protein A4D02_17280 [Niastella koreensis]
MAFCMWNQLFFATATRNTITAVLTASAIIRRHTITTIAIVGGLAYAGDYFNVGLQHYKASFQLPIDELAKLF